MRLTRRMRDAFIRAAMDDVPQIDYDVLANKAAHDASVKMMPPAVRSAYRATPEWFRSEYCHYGSKIFYLPLPDNTNLPEEAKEKLKELAALENEQSEAREVLKDKLRAAAYGVNTRSALADLLPEFEKYLPTAPPVVIKTLPAVTNLVADFSASGWPKNGKKKSK